MTSNRVGRLLLVGAILTMLPPASGYAQEATLTGTVTDSTGAVLPGVTVRAVNEASGNNFEAVSGGRGEYRIPVRIGGYKVTAELSGFATVTRTVTLLVGQEAVVNLQMSPSGVQETVTVTGEAPLVEVTQSKVGGNIDARQVSELPLNGRNWMDLSMLAPGSTANAVTAEPTAVNTTGNYQINLDGQQVTQNILGGFGQPQYSRDAIAEFELVSNRFDASQGRSSGVQVNAVTKSGTNTPSGSLSGYFRDSSMNAADLVAHRVLPYSDQQVSGTFGAPIVKDKVHYFASYEHERQPHTFVFTTPVPAFNQDVSSTDRQDKGAARLDYQLRSQVRFSVRYTYWNYLQPDDPRFVGGSTFTPGHAQGVLRKQNQILGTLSQVLNNRTLNEIKVGYTLFNWDQFSDVKNPTSTFNDPYTGPGYGVPQINVRGLNLGGSVQNPQFFQQAAYTFRDDFSHSFSKGGSHALKLGTEYFYQVNSTNWCSSCLGFLDATNGPRPANIDALFPNVYDASTWNLAALSPITRLWRQAVGKFDFTIPMHKYAAWLQEDWTISRRLTLNLGVRYDLEIGAYANNIGVAVAPGEQPFLPANRPNDTDNIVPRTGFAYTLNDRTVIRGGWGKYFSEEQNFHGVPNLAQAAIVEVLNDGRPDFAANPFNGPIPTLQQVLATSCSATNFAPGCVRRTVITGLPTPNAQVPYSYQSSIGVQRQFGDATAVTADYVYNGGRGLKNTDMNINLAYNPVTGANYPFTNFATRPYPDWGAIPGLVEGGWSNSHALQTSFTRRFSQRWQASGTYTLSGNWDAFPQPLNGVQVVSFPVARDLGAEYTLAANDQRHRAVFNAIWQPGFGFQLSGLYFYGSGQRFVTTCGCGDQRDASVTADRLRPDGTIVPRNNFVGLPIHRVDLRLQRRFQLGGHTGIDGLVEVFNLFNHANYGSYNTVETSGIYGNPSQNTNVAYGPRAAQLGFRFTF